MAGRSRKWLWAAGIVAALIVVPTAVFWPQISMILMFIQASKPPATPFADTLQPPAPDYGSPASWAALPDRKDDADVVPAMDTTDGQAAAPVDVFFIHPTTYFSNKTWNAPVDEPTAKDITDQDILRNQASAFNKCCRVYAPRYRQIAFGAQQGAPEEAGKGWDLAYSDVRAAFEHYLQHFNHGRPFIIASHSQGTMHALHLMEDLLTGKPLREKLVAAYLIGIPIPTDVFTQTLPDIPLCAAPEQTGCAITWNAIGPSADTSLFHSIQHRYPSGQKASIVGKALACTNPLGWKTDEEPGARAAQLGGVRFAMGTGAPPKPDPALVDAQCRKGWLVISTPAPKAYREVLLGPDMYHVYDYSLFYVDIRENAQTRVKAFLQTVSLPPPH
ncbi:DUF3089 domain-containing protein [Corallococcus carmarthensis]|uniref:DUF3089 domain-containing protein n=1 Tax=Corallococcus carmarthensis TaxID=2316728 RepID=A0A3A8K7P4_9BACT|nr:DUF3089 domain-containing protein [Corallococcus carmarthensis]RKH03219.1 DUF3089 domain-containing protein [Corallococcus carmarthensis]